MAINTTLLYFLLLVPLSGFIAWAGDKIGHKIGKKRQSLFGLRPRHTATFITVTAGVGITLASFLVMFASSGSFRDAVLRGNQLRRENAELLTERDQLNRAIRLAAEKTRERERDAQRAEQDAKIAEQARDDAQRRRTLAEKNFTKSQAELTAAAKQLAQVQARLGTTQNGLETAERALTEARKTLQAATLRRDQAQAEATSARGEVERARRVFDQVTKLHRERLASRDSELRELTSRITILNSQLAEKQLDLDAREKQLADQERRAEVQKRELARLNTEIAEAEERRTQMQASLDALQRDTLALRNGQLTYRVGEEVLRASIAPGMSVWKVQNRLEELLTEASKRARARGARSISTTTREVQIPEKWVVREDKTRERFNEADAVRTAAINIRTANEEVAVIVVAVGNALVGEPVSVDLKTWRNPLILQAGEKLGELTLDGRSASQDVADQLYAFLRGELRKRLLAAGTIPNGDTVGEASLDGILKTLDAVRSSKSRTRVTVRTATALRAADPVVLEFEVKPVGQAPFVIPP